MGFQVLLKLGTIVVFHESLFIAGRRSTLAPTHLLQPLLEERLFLDKLHQLTFGHLQLYLFCVVLNLHNMIALSSSLLLQLVLQFDIALLDGCETLYLPN